MNLQKELDENAFTLSSILFSIQFHIWKTWNPSHSCLNSLKAKYDVTFHHKHSRLTLKHNFLAICLVDLTPLSIFYQPPNQKSAYQQVWCDSAVYSILQGSNEKQSPGCHYQSPLRHFPPNSIYPLRFWSVAWAGKKEVLFRKRWIIRSNLSPVGVEKLVSSFTEERWLGQKQLLGKEEWQKRAI